MKVDCASMGFREVLVLEKARHRIASFCGNLLELILLPTEACNFRCTYCYEEFRYGRMEPGVVRGVKKLLSIRAPELDVLNLSWFGGEPLLARDIIENVMDHARSLADEQPRLRLSSEMTTNAYFLTKAVFERMLAVGVTGYQISLDGPSERHDRKRVLTDGGGTFDRIWGNLVAMREVEGDFSVTLRLHVDRENYLSLPRFIDECQEAFGNDPRFTLFVRPLARLGGPNDSSLPVFSESEGKRLVGKLSRRNGACNASLSEGEDEAIDVCYAARANSFVVRANGRLNKCTVALEHPLNQVGRIREDGSVEIDTPKMRGWMRGLWSDDREELECPMHGYAEPTCDQVELAGSVSPA